MHYRRKKLFSGISHCRRLRISQSSAGEIEFEEGSEVGDSIAQYDYYIDCKYV
jgi:hypothetical protein